jgi:hypothetical protein
MKKKRRSNQATERRRGINAIGISLVYCVSVATSLRRSFVSALLAFLIVTATGCNILGFVADKTTTGETKDANYVLPSEPTVVIVENWRNPTGAAIDAEQVQREVSENLASHQIGPQIDPTAVIDLKSRRRDFGKLSIAEIGKLVGAKQVVYINLTNTSLTAAEGSDSYTGKVTARVKVVDTESGEARWPTDSVEGYPISISTPVATARNESDRNELREKLLAAASDRISKLFYKARAEE